MHFCSKQIIKIAKKTITEKIRGRGRQHEPDEADKLYELSRCNSEDFEAGGGGTTRDSDTVCFKEKHLVSVEVVQNGLVRFSLMMEMSAPGTVPDPLLIAALIDLVSPLPCY